MKAPIDEAIEMTNHLAEKLGETDAKRGISTPPKPFLEGDEDAVSLLESWRIGWQRFANETPHEHTR